MPSAPGSTDAAAATLLRPPRQPRPRPVAPGRRRLAAPALVHAAARRALADRELRHPLVRRSACSPGSSARRARCGKALYVAVPVTLVEMTGFVIKHFVGRAAAARRRPQPAASRSRCRSASRSRRRTRAWPWSATFTLGALYPRGVPALVALTLVLCFSRVYLGVHYLGDVLGGLVYGLLFGAAWVLARPGAGADVTRPEHARRAAAVAVGGRPRRSSSAWPPPARSTAAADRRQGRAAVGRRLRPPPTAASPTPRPRSLARSVGARAPPTPGARSARASSSPAPSSSTATSRALQEFIATPARRPRPLGQHRRRQGGRVGQAARRRRPLRLRRRRRGLHSTTPPASACCSRSAARIKTRRRRTPSSSSPSAPRRRASSARAHYVTPHERRRAARDHRHDRPRRAGRRRRALRHEPLRRRRPGCATTPLSAADELGVPLVTSPGRRRGRPAGAVAAPADDAPVRRRRHRHGGVQRRATGRRARDGTGRDRRGPADLAYSARHRRLRRREATREGPAAAARHAPRLLETLLTSKLERTPVKLGIVGLPNVGKTTLFNALTHAQAAATAYAFTSAESNLGVVAVPDPRLDRLDEVLETPKKVNATIDVVDIAGLAEGASRGEGLGNRFLADIRGVDAVAHVIRVVREPRGRARARDARPARRRRPRGDGARAQRRRAGGAPPRQDAARRRAAATRRPSTSWRCSRRCTPRCCDGRAGASASSAPADDEPLFRELALVSDRPVLFVLNTDDDQSAAAALEQHARLRGVGARPGRPGGRRRRAPRGRARRPRARGGGRVPRRARRRRGRHARRRPARRLRGARLHHLLHRRLPQQRVARLAAAPRLDRQAGRRPHPQRHRARVRARPGREHRRPHRAEARSTPRARRRCCAPRARSTSSRTAT